jgi:hypothetical protein
MKVWIKPDNLNIELVINEKTNITEIVSVMYSKSQNNVKQKISKKRKFVKIFLI